MRVFELTPAEGPGLWGEVDSPWCLPGVHCTVCGEAWANVGIAYPTVSLAALPDRAGYEDGWPVPWERFLELRTKIQHLLPSDQPAPPGTSLGALAGALEGTVQDLMWPHPWTLLCTQGAFLRLRTAGWRSLKGAAATVTLNGRAGDVIFELEVVAHGALAASCRGAMSTCEACGRDGLTRPERIVLDRRSLSEEAAIFRLRDLTTAIFAWEPVVGTLARLGFYGWRAKEVDVA